jgi:hypothetical protein
MGGWGGRQVAGGEWVGQPQPEDLDEYVPPIPDNPPPTPSIPAQHRRQTHVIRLAVIVGIVGIAIFAILLVAGIL